MLPGSARCVDAKPDHFAHEVDQMIDRHRVDPNEVHPLADCSAGSIVYVEHKGPKTNRWLKLRVLNVA